MNYCLVNFQKSILLSLILIHNLLYNRPVSRVLYKKVIDFMSFSSIEQFVGNTPLVCLKRLPGETSNAILVKLEGNNPAGSVKDRPALSMIRCAEERGEIKARRYLD